MFDNTNFNTGKFINGASGYVLKNAMPEEIIKGVETVMSGQIFLCHEVDMLETIKSYRKNLLFKLNAKNTAALVKMALEEKLV